MTTQVYDDGSSVTYDDASGAVTAVINSAGQSQYVPPADGSGAMQQFAALFNQGVQAVTSTVSTRLQGSLGPKSTPPGTPQPVGALGAYQKYLPLALIAGGVLLAVKYLR